MGPFIACSYSGQGLWVRSGTRSNLRIPCRGKIGMHRLALSFSVNYFYPAWSFLLRANNKALSIEPSLVPPLFSFLVVFEWAAKPDELPMVPSQVGLTCATASCRTGCSCRRPRTFLLSARPSSTASPSRGTKRRRRKLAVIPLSSGSMRLSLLLL